MHDIFYQYAVDPKAEQEGREFPLGTGTVLVARLNNPAYNRMLSARFEQYKHVLEKTDPSKHTDAEIAEAKRRSRLIMAEVLAHTVLLGFKDLGYKGAPIEYSVANAQMLLEHEQFANEITKLSADFRNYRFKTEEEDAKNSATTSGGTAPGEPSSTSSSN